MKQIYKYYNHCWNAHGTLITWISYWDSTIGHWWGHLPPNPPPPPSQPLLHCVGVCNIVMCYFQLLLPPIQKLSKNTAFNLFVCGSIMDIHLIITCHLFIYIFIYFGLLMFNSHLQDPRIMQTVAILLGIDSDVADSEGKCSFALSYLLHQIMQLEHIVLFDH